MSVHKDCGELINWFKRPDDMARFLPPMEYVGQMYMVTETESGEKAAVQVAGYKVHNCDPEKMLAWQEYQAKVAVIKEHGKVQAKELNLPNNAWEMARDKRQEEARAFAQQVACPMCEALEGQPCFNLTIFKREGLTVPTKSPHLGRTRRAEKESS